MENKIKINALFPVLFSFFVMGFVDMVGISVSYVKEDFSLNDKIANLLPMMVFVWFAVFSLPTGRLLGKLGRKNTVMLSAAITVVAMLLPVINYSFPMAMAAFALLGIGNTILQVSLNPLMTDIVPREKVTGMLVLGQFIKAISSTLGPVIIGFLAAAFGNWKLVFPVYAAVTAISWIWLVLVKIQEEKADNAPGAIGSLFKDKYLMMLFSGIILIVGFEIGLMTAVPKYLAERFSMTLEQGGLACSLYYIARTAGTFIGSIILSKVNIKKLFIGLMIAAIACFAGFMLSQNSTMIFAALFLIGLTCANVFGIILGEALRYRPQQANEISALMITGVAGGALLPPVMGIIADGFNQAASLIVPFAALVYILFISFKVKQ